MPRVSKRYARVELSRTCFEAIDLGLADGLSRFGDAVISTAQVPDAPPYGKGLVTRGGFITFLNGRQVAGTASRPSSEWVSAKGVVTFVGWGFPARFNEMGTVNQPARPFASPALDRQMQYLDSHMAPAMQARLAVVP